MPTRPLTPCRAPMCPHLAPAGQRGYCDLHKQDATRYDRDRGSAHSRGYTRRWQQWRLWFLQRHPLCADCKAEGRVTAAEQVHHVLKVRDYPDRQYDERNCMALCERHHSIRTQRGE